MTLQLRSWMWSSALNVRRICRRMTSGWPNFLPTFWLGSIPGSRSLVRNPNAQNSGSWHAALIRSSTSLRQPRLKRLSQWDQSNLHLLYTQVLGVGSLGLAISTTWALAPLIHMLLQPRRLLQAQNFSGAFF